MSGPIWRIAASEECGLRKSTASLITAMNTEDKFRTASTNGSRSVEADDGTGAMSTTIMLS